MDDVATKLAQISRSLRVPGGEDGSLLGGRLGRLLFAAGAADSGDEDLARGVNFSAYSDLTYSSGLAGCLWFVRHLARRKNIDERCLVDEDVYALLLEHAIGLLAEGDFDPLHGAIGIALFALEGDEICEPQLLSRFVETLAAEAIGDGASKSWRYLGLRSDEDYSGRMAVSMGMAHGHFGVMAFLLKCAEKGLNSPLVEELLHQAGQFAVDSCAACAEVHGEPRVPAMIIDGQYMLGRRLAWCYGDLSSAYTLLRVAEYLGINAWREQALNILIWCAENNDREAYPMRDASLCHGTAGASYLLGKLYRATNEPVFKTASEDLLMQTLAFGRHGRWAGSYRYFDGRRLVPRRGLLEGAAGIGLTLRAHLQDFDANSTGWDACLLLS